METSTISHYFTNITTDEESQQRDLQERIINIMSLTKVLCITCYSITFILGVVGNGFTIWITGFKMQKSINIVWFLNLAIADFVFDITLPFLIKQWVSYGVWSLGQIMCKIIYFLIYVNMLVSTAFLVLISVDRCISIQCPVWSKNHRTTRLASIISIAAWFFGLTVNIPYAVYYEIEETYFFNENVTYCRNTYFSRHNISTFDDKTFDPRYSAIVFAKFIFLFLIPFCVILVCYCLIAVQVMKNRHVFVSGRPFKVMIAIIISFFSCWFPFYFLNVLYITIHINDWEVYYMAVNVSYCLAFFNSFLNPILYVFIGRDFKKRLRNLLFSLGNEYSVTG